MDPITYSLLSFGLVAGVMSLGGAILLRWWSPVLWQRLQPPKPEAGRESILRWEDRPRAGWEQALNRLGQAFVPHDRARLSRIRERLVWAGYHNPRAVSFFIGMKVGLLIFFGCSYFIYGVAIERVLPHVLLISFIFAVPGYMLPDLWLRWRIKARQRDVLHALPNVLDLLMVCIEAGMGFDSAVARVAERPESRLSPLHQEMLRMHLEVRAGRPREEAFRGLGERTGVPDLMALVGAFIQAEQLGTPLGKTLRIHAESARVQRRLRAEERAQLAPLKMIFPTVIFLFPVFFLVTFAPGLLGLMDVFKAMQQ